MKFFLAVLFVAGACAHQSTFKTGKHYEYEYKSRAITGIPEIEKVLSGTGLRSRVIIQAINENELIVKMTDLAVADLLNKEVQYQNWRQETPLNYSPIEGEKAQLLAQPFKLYLESGKVVAIETVRDEPMYVRNIKKAVATQLSLNLHKLDEVTLRTNVHLDEEIVNDINRDFYVVEEDSIAGECRTHYTMVPLPAFLAKEETHSLPEEIKRFTSDKRAMVMTKTRDYDSCTKMPSYAKITLPEMSTETCVDSQNGCGQFTARTSVTNYLVAVTEEDKLDIIRVWTEGEMVVRPFASKTETLVTVSNQTLSLIKYNEIRTPIPEIRSQVIRQGLVFEMSQQESQNEITADKMYRNEEIMGESNQFDTDFERRHVVDSQLFDEEERLMNDVMTQTTKYNTKYPFLGQRSVYDKYSTYSDKVRQVRQTPRMVYPSLTKAPRLPYMESHLFQQIPVQKIKSQVRSLLMEVVETIETLEKVTEKEPAEKMHLISRLISHLSLKEIRELYNEIIPETYKTNSMHKTLRTLFLDAVVMSGTNPAIMFIKEKIVKREVKGEQAAQLLMTIPVSIKTPTPEILKELTDLATKVPMFKNEYTTLIHTITNIINRACLNRNTQQYYVYGKFGTVYCTPRDVEIVLPMLKEHLSRAESVHQITVLLHAIGEMGHREVMHLLRPFVVGQKTMDSQIRTKAIFSLFEMTKVHPSQVFALLKPIFTNVQEHPEVRMAAFSVILNTQPPKAFFTEVATQTWFEQSQLVGSFVYSTLVNLANSTMPHHMEISNIANVVLPLAKKFDLGLHYPMNTMYTKYNTEYKQGQVFQVAHFGSLFSMIPKDMYLEKNVIVGGLEFPVFQYTMQLQGIQKFLNKNIFNVEKDQHIPIDLDIKPRHDENLQGSIHYKIMGVYQRFMTLEHIKEYLLEDLLEFNGNKMEFNYKKSFLLHESIVSMPLDLGMPVTVSFRVPALISLTGRVHFDMESRLFNLKNVEKNIMPKNMKIELDIKPLITVNSIMEVSNMSPFTKKVYSAGVNTHAQIILPGKVQVVLRNGELELNFKPTEGRIPRETEIFTLRTTPYVAVREFFEARRDVRVVFHGKNEKLQHNKIEFGYEYLGLPFQYVEKYDRSFKPVTVHPMELISKVFGFMTEVKYETIKFSEHKMILKNEESQTQVIRFKINMEEAREQFSMNSMKFEKEMERKYYKQHSDEHFDKTEQYVEKYYQSPLSVLPECRQQGTPCYEVLKSFNNVHDVEHRRRVQEESLIKADEHYGIHSEITFEGQQTRKFRSTIIFGKNIHNTERKMSILFEKEDQTKPFRVCVNGQLRFPVMTSSRQQMLEKPKTTFGHMEIGFGRTCEQSQIKTHIVMEQTEEMKRFAIESPESRVCSELEQQGLVLSEMCLKARFQAAYLNKYLLDFEYHNLPKYFVNMTSHVEDYYRHHLYHHMSSDVTVRNQENKVKIVLEVRPNMQSFEHGILNAMLIKPTETVLFKNVQPTSFFTKYVLPINAKYETVDRTMYNLYKSQNYPTCKIERDVMTTFDNVTFRYPLKECYHLIAKDCSMNMPVQVLAKEQSEGKIVKIQISKNVVEIIPGFKVIFNGKHIELPQVDVTKKIQEGRHTILEITRRIDSLVVVTPVHGVIVQHYGQRVFELTMSNMYRGRVCGLCGDMNGEKVAEFKTPSRCIVVRPEVFGRSYALESCRVSDKTFPECLREHQYEQTEINTNEFSTRYEQVIRKNDQTYQCQKFNHKITHDVSRICFSVEPIRHCKLACSPRGQLKQEVGFHCMQHGREADMLAARAIAGPVEELRTKSITFTHKIAVPERCVRY